ncbi:hypothetical protein ACLOJK_018813, partial [Asimina triloba]
MLAWDVIEDAVFGESSDADQEEQHDAQISLSNEEYPNGISFMAIHDDERPAAGTAARRATVVGRMRRDGTRPATGSHNPQA